MNESPALQRAFFMPNTGFPTIVVSPVYFNLTTKNTYTIIGGED